MRGGARVAGIWQELKCVGVEHVPLEGPVILAARHYHHLYDGVGLTAQIERPLHILVALDWINRRSTRAMMEALSRYAEWPVTLRSEAFGEIAETRAPLKPSAYAPNDVLPYQQRAHRQCLQLLSDGRAVVIFPEGYPAIDPHTSRGARTTPLAPFKPGFARLAISASRRSGVPTKVVPVGIQADDGSGGALTFVYGEIREVDASSPIEGLTSQIYDDVLKLSQ